MLTYTREINEGQKGRFEISMLGLLMDEVLLSTTVDEIFLMASFPILQYTTLDVTLTLITQTKL